MGFIMQNWPHWLGSGIVVAAIIKAADKFFLKKLSMIENVKDPDIRAYIAQGLVLLVKKFPIGGIPLAIHRLVMAMPELRPFEPALVEIAQNLEHQLADDVHKQLDPNFVPVAKPNV